MQKKINKRNLKKYEKEKTLKTRTRKIFLFLLHATKYFSKKEKKKIESHFNESLSVSPEHNYPVYQREEREIL